MTCLYILKNKISVSYYTNIKFLIMFVLVWKNIRVQFQGTYYIQSVRLIKISYRFKPLFNLKQKKIPEIRKYVSWEEFKMKINMDLPNVIRSLFMWYVKNPITPELKLFFPSFSWHPFAYLSLKVRLNGYKWHALHEQKISTQLKFSPIKSSMDKS